MSCVRNMIYAILVFLLYRRYPDFIDNMRGFGTLWGQLLSVTTFTLTFFVNQSYALWRKCIQLSRRLQGRLHDINMNLATHATRKAPSTPTEPSTYTPQSRQILELMSRYVRVFNLLCYASFTRSHRPILTPRGMRRLVERGLLTAQERQALVDAAIPPTQRHSAVLMWMIRLFVEGRASGHILGGDGFEQHTMDKFHVIRAQYGGIGDELQGRMPLAYAHIVQILVDLILWMYPVMAFSTGMSPFLVIAGTGLLTISYQGLFDLAKQFLDPYDNENYGKGEDPLSVDTLIAETNAGSVRWWFGFEEMPFNAQQLRDGELYDSLLPVRGYSVQDLAEMEEDRIKKDKAKKKKEEEERLKREEEEILNGEKEEAEEVLSVGNETIPESNLTTASDNITIVSMEDIDLNETLTTYELEKDVANISTTSEKPVHTVVTLGGKPVSVKTLGVDETEADVNNLKPVAAEPAVPLAASKYLASLTPTDKQDEVSDTIPASEERTSDKEGKPLSSDDYQTKLSETKEAFYQRKLKEIEEAIELLNEVSTLSSDDYQEKLQATKEGFYQRKLQEIEESIESLNSSPEAKDDEDIHLVIEKKETIEPVVEELEEPDEDTEAPMSFQDYEKEVERIVIEAKEEMLETEAILSTKSGLDPLEWDYDDEQLESMTSAQDIEDDGDVELEVETKETTPVATLEEEAPTDSLTQGDVSGTDYDVEGLDVLEMDLTLDDGEVEDKQNDINVEGSEDRTPENERDLADNAMLPNEDDVKLPNEESVLVDPIGQPNKDHFELSNENPIELSTEEGGESTKEDNTDTEIHSEENEDSVSEEDS